MGQAFEKAKHLFRVIGWSVRPAGFRLRKAGPIDRPREGSKPSPPPGKMGEADAGIAGNSGPQGRSDRAPDGFFGARLAPLHAPFAAAKIF